MQSASVLSPDKTEILFDHFAPASGERFRGTLLFVYGGSVKPNFRHEIKPFAEMLSLLGFRVITFDYRSNREGADFYSFGIHDRIEDTKRAIKHMKTLGQPPYSIVGWSMGGHITVRAVAETDGKMFENVILIAPAAYPEDATRRGVLYGETEGRFGNIIRRPHAPTLSDAFKAAEQIDARLLLIRFIHDTTVRKKITDTYWSAFGRSHRGNTDKYYAKEAGLVGEHKGTLTDAKRIRRILEEIDSFTAVPETVAAR